MMATITGANAILSISILGIYNTPFTVQGYAADDAFKSEAVPQTETVMGVDGNLSGGFIYAPYKMTIMIMPDSPSLENFEIWRTTQNAAVDAFPANGVIIMPSIGQQYTLVNGFLTSAHPFPDVKKLLQGIPYEITWNAIVSSPVAVL
jgi:hypothetical protein